MTTTNSTEAREAAGVAAMLCSAAHTRGVEAPGALVTWLERDQLEATALVLAAVLDAVVERRTAFAGMADLCRWLRDLAHEGTR